MIKILLLLLIIGGSAVLGQVISGAMAERENALKAVFTGVKTLNNCIIHQKMPLAEAFLRGASASGLEVFRRMSELMYEQPELTGEQLGPMASGENGLFRSILEKDDVRGFYGFIRTIYDAAVTEQVDEVSKRYLRELEAEREAAKGERIRRGRLAKSLCIMGGVAVAILLT